MDKEHHDEHAQSKQDESVQALLLLKTGRQRANKIRRVRTASTWRAQTGKTRPMSLRTSSTCCTASETNQYFHIVIFQLVRRMASEHPKWRRSGKKTVFPLSHYPKMLNIANMRH